MTAQTPPRQVDLRADLDGHYNLFSSIPSAGGRTEFTVVAGNITDDEQEFFGRCYCHWLAAAIHSITGWDLVTIDYRPTGSTEWAPAHTGALTPDGVVLDIFGQAGIAAVRERYAVNGAESRHRIVAGPDMPGDVITDAGDLRGDHLWWTRMFDDPGLQGVVLHFARLLLRRHGYGDHISAAAQPRPRQPAEPKPAKPAVSQRTSTTPAPPHTQEKAMSIPDEVARLFAIAERIPLGLLEQLSRHELPSETLLAAQELNSLADEIRSITGNTSSSSEATTRLAIAVSKLNRAREAHTITQMHLSKALRAAAQAKHYVEQAAQHHSH